MNREHLISIIMPAYNAERFIAESIFSVLQQTFEDWELIIVDDSSTDRTKKIIEEFNDRRIRYVLLEENGGAYLARKHGFEISKGKWIINLDSDDYLEESYIQKLYCRMQEIEDVDIVCSQMVYISEDGKKTNSCIPNSDFNFDEILTGKQAFDNTIPDYKIGLNGILVRRELWQTALQKHVVSRRMMIHDDEILFRRILLEARKVGFIRSSYFYRINTVSVTHEFNEKVFEFAICNQDLIALTVEKYGKVSNEYRWALLYDYYAFLGGMINYINSINSLKREKINWFYEKFNEWYQAIEFKLLTEEQDNLKMWISKHWQLLLFTISIRNHKLLNYSKLLIYRGIQWGNRLIHNEVYYWFYRRRIEKENRKKIKDYYSNKKSSPKNASPFVVCLYEGAIHSGGLADRFKGIVSVYSICKEKKIDFKILYKYPFELKDYIVPNTYNWEIEEEKISYEWEKVKVICLETTKESDFQYKLQKKYLRKHLIRSKEQIHVYTNAGFVESKLYTALFNELFKPSDRLQKSINLQKEILGSNYISVSCRFLNLFGDFNEPYGVSKPLEKEKQLDLINRVLNEMDKLNSANSGRKILVNSDSEIFLEYARKRDYVYVIPGTVTHIDNEIVEKSYNKYEKTFLDFYCIAGASQIYLIKSREMYKSGYPILAAKTEGKTVQLIEI